MTNLVWRSESDFRSARAQAGLRKIIGLISGRKRELLSFTEVQHHLRLGGPIYRGVQTIPIAKIVGSVDRYKDFDSVFSPTQTHTAERWRRITRAWYKEISLPPVQLYQVGEVYFVIDGNHRVSVARNQGQEFIDAEVREVHALVPVTPNITADDLVRLGAQVDFIERCEIDRLFPGTQIETTILGGYDRLIEHIAVHRYFMGLDLERSIPVEEAVVHWYETIYAPVVDVIDESKILDELKDKTEADLYLWVMDHYHYLHTEVGKESLRPADAASDFIGELSEDD